MANGKFAKKKSKKPALLVTIVVLLLLVLVGLGIFVIPQWLYSMSGEAESLSDETAASLQETTEGTDAAANSVSYPVALAEGQLEITSLYTYSGINPDCNNQEGSNIAAIMLKNASDGYLAEAAITLALSDGSSANFAVTDLPAGKTIMAFSTENLSLAADTVCVEADCESTFEPGASLSEDAVSVHVDGMTVTLVNTSGRDLTNIVVYCHNILEPDYFGGKAYPYTIENLPAGASTTVDAVDCILGLAEVVRIDAE